MGWTHYTDPSTTRKELIKDRLAHCAGKLGEGTYTSTVRRHAVRSNRLWKLVEFVQFSKDGVQDVVRYVALDLFRVDSYGCQGYKDMSETCGPNYYDCPISFLEMTTQVDNQAWRDNVLEWHTLQKERKAFFKSLKVGDIVGSQYGKYPKLEIASLNPLQAYVYPQRVGLFGIRKRFVTAIKYTSWDAQFPIGHEPAPTQLELFPIEAEGKEFMWYVWPDGETSTTLLEWKSGEYQTVFASTAEEALSLSMYTEQVSASIWHTVSAGLN